MSTESVGIVSSTDSVPGDILPSTPPNVEVIEVTPTTDLNNESNTFCKTSPKQLLEDSIKDPADSLVTPSSNRSPSGSVHTNPDGLFASISDQPITVDPNEDTSSQDDSIPPTEDLITNNMLEEEEKLHQKSEMDRQQACAAAQAEYDELIEKQRFQRLKFLLEKTSIYSKFLSEKMELQQKERRERGEKEHSNQPSIKVEEESHPLQETEEYKDDMGKKKRGRPPAKRKATDEGYNIADYLEDGEKAKKFKVEANDEVQEQQNQEQEQEQIKAEEVAEDLKSISHRQPPLVTGGTLREYQLAGVEWLISLYENGLNGILADEMGLGKTLQTISFLAFLRGKGVWGPYLIVAPLSTLGNWINEFKRFAPSIPVILYHGSIQDRQTLRNKHLKQFGVSFPIIVTSYEIVMNDRKHLQKFPWKYIVVDEGHRIKNLNCKLIRELKSYHSANRLLLTGTPLQNNLAELWSLLNFLLPDIFDDLDSFQSWFDFSDLHNEEGQERILGQEASHSIVSKLHHILKPFLLRRLKVDVEKELPKKKEFILYAPLTATQKTYYEATLNKTLRQLMFDKNDITEGETSEGKESKEVDITDNTPLSRRKSRRSTKEFSYEELTDDEYFKSIENLPEVPEESVSNETLMKELNEKTETKRRINNMKLLNVMMQLRKVCNHPFLFDHPVDQETGHYLFPDNIASYSGKMKLLEQLLPVLFERDHKVLIFSQFTSMLDILEGWLEDVKGWHCCRIDGSIKLDSRQEQIDAFNKRSDYRIFLLSTRAGGLGINLTAADTVIIYDSDWNPQMDLQAQDRAHRIGQKKPVMVYRLATSNTIESKMLEKTSVKRKLEKMVILKGKFKGRSNDGQALSINELAEILRTDDGEKVTLAEADGKETILSAEEMRCILDRSDQAFSTSNEPQNTSRIQHVKDSVSKAESSELF